MCFKYNVFFLHQELQIVLSVHHYPPFQPHQTISLHLTAWQVSQLAKILLVPLKWKYFLVPNQNFKFSNIVISILNYPFSYCSSYFAEAKVVALNLFASFLYRFCMYIYSWLLSSMALRIVIALPTIEITIAVVLFQSQRQLLQKKKKILSQKKEV